MELHICNSLLSYILTVTKYCRGIILTNLVNCSKDAKINLKFYLETCPCVNNKLSTIFTMMYNKTCQLFYYVSQHDIVPP